MIARDSLQTEAHRVHQSLIATMITAQEQYETRLAEEAMTPKQLEKATSYRNFRMKQALKVAGEHLNAALECAMLFDETENLQDCFQGLRDAIKAQTTAYTNLVS
jgi:hypothetical protein